MYGMTLLVFLLHLERDGGVSLCSEVVVYPCDASLLVGLYKYKKKPNTANCVTAIWSSVICTSVSLEMTQGGTAFCCFSLGSLILNAWYNRCRKKLDCRSSSFVGLSLFFSLKVAQYETAPLTVLLARRS